MAALYENTVSPFQAWVTDQSPQKAQSSSLFADWLAQQVTSALPLMTTSAIATLPPPFTTSTTSASTLATEGKSYSPLPYAAPWSAFHSSRGVSPIAHDTSLLPPGPSTVSDHTGSPSHHSQSEPEHESDTKALTQAKRATKRRPRIMTDKRREQNRLAQRNLRARRQQEMAEHQHQVDELEHENAELRLAVKALRRENEQLRATAAAAAQMNTFSLLQ